MKKLALLAVLGFILILPATPTEAGCGLLGRFGQGRVRGFFGRVFSGQVLESRRQARQARLGDC
jgi:hypothetical protein